MVPQHETLCNPYPQRRDDGDGIQQEQRVQETASPHRSDSRILLGQSGFNDKIALLSSGLEQI